MQDTVLALSALVFPRGCESQRVIAAHPSLNLSFSSSSSDPAFRIGHNQRICIWPANPGSHSIRIQTDTEHGFDVLKMFSKEGLITAFSGQMESHFPSFGGVEFFIWETDGDGLSSGFSIAIPEDWQYPYPPFTAVLRGNQVLDVSLIFVDSDEPGLASVPPRATDRVGRSETKKLLPVLIGFTVGLLVLALGVIAWCVTECLSYRSDFGSRPEEEQSRVKSKVELVTGGEYQSAADESSMPGPYFLNGSGDI
jgi:hypothetical protein